MNSKIPVNLFSHELNQEPLSDYTNPQDQVGTIKLLLEMINKIKEGTIPNIVLMYGTLWLKGTQVKHKNQNDGSHKAYPSQDWSQRGNVGNVGM